MAMQIDIKKLKCKRCSHEWFPRGIEVRICPKCKSAFWDRERKSKGNK